MQLTPNHDYNVPHKGAEDWHRPLTDDEDPIHVQTTPYSADSGLAVEERSTDRLVLADRDGQDDYEFAYTVRGTRNGHADDAVVRGPSEDVEGGGRDAAPTPAAD